MHWKNLRHGVYCMIMHLVALLTSDHKLAKALADFRDPSLNVYLHAISPLTPLEQVAQSLKPLDFAGALILEPPLQQQAYAIATRSSLDAQEVEAVDVLTVTPSGLLGEFNLGRAIGQTLRNAQWDGRGAKAVVIGSGRLARAVSRELSSLGVQRLALLARSRPSAENSLSRLAASTEVVTQALASPGAATMLEQADLLIRIDTEAHIPRHILGPHLTLVDLFPQAMSQLRQDALSMGALTLSLRDVQAHHLALSLNHILGSKLGAEHFLEVMHALEI